MAQRILSWLIGLLTVAAIALAFTVQAVVPDPQDRSAGMGASEPAPPSEEESWMRSETRASDNSLQHPASLSDGDRSLEERVINTLKAENRKLADELGADEEELKQLAVDRELLLIQSQTPNAPAAATIVGDPLREARKQAGAHIRNLLQSTSLGQGLHPEEREIIARLAVDSYQEIMRRSRLGMADELQQIILDTALPDYSQCLREGIPYIAPLAHERQRLLRYLETGNSRQLNYRHLREDYEVITQECFSALTDQVNRRIAAG
ncbi:hypothetical protein [Motiliproteus sp. SC1-56]|uniref:hypothetical protein n=1 Tax=Motiliproteus sp. SC1-56 TaxID=2799565 RepID=UPI001A8DC2E5|nr:hypothetical protein [Motiliproteus sp. SC1-56]